MSAALKIFIIYAREDRIYKDDLLKSLKLLQTQGLIEPWHDSNIKPGDEWDKEIKAHLQAADIILPIISFDFFDSDYIHRVEIVEAFERYDRGEALIVPIIADSCPWIDYPRLKDFQALPIEGKPIDDWPDRKKAMSSIYEGVKGIILEKKKRAEMDEKHAIRFSEHEESEKVLEKRNRDKSRRQEKTERLKKEKEKEQSEKKLLEAERFFNLGYRATDMEEQINYYSRAIEINPEYYYAFNNRGWAKLRLGQNEEALKDFDQAISIKPDYPIPYFNRGWIKFKLENYEQSIKDFDQLILIEPYNAVAYCLRARAKLKLEQYQAAIKDCDQAIRINPNYPEAYNERGIAKENLGLLGEARLDYLKAINSIPSYEPAKGNLKRLQFKLK